MLGGLCGYYLHSLRLCYNIQGVVFLQTANLLKIKYIIKPFSMISFVINAINWNLLYLFDRMPNNGSPLVGSNLSCIRQINLMMQSAFAEVICISILFQVCIHQGNCYRFIIKRTIVHNLNTHALING